jgi:phage portal protein BeeE
VLHGVQAADFGADELLYLPRNVRSHRLCGFSPVEQIALTVNIALRRERATLDYYNTGSVPNSFATLPKEWKVDQIRQFQDYFDALMAGTSHGAA